MVKSLSLWAEQIILAVIIATIIEMLLPNGNNKKYIKAIIGVYILFTIISPIASKVIKFDDIDIDYDKYFEDTKTYETMSESLNNSNYTSIEAIYVENLKQDIKYKLNDMGYKVKNCKIELYSSNENNYGKIEKIEVNVEEQNEEDSSEIIKPDDKVTINTIEKVNIGNTISNETIIETYEQPLSANQIKEIKTYLSGVYEVKEENIKINYI